MDCSLPGPSVSGILQARILEQVAMPSPGDVSGTRIEPALNCSIKENKRESLIIPLFMLTSPPLSAFAMP